MPQQTRKGRRCKRAEPRESGMEVDMEMGATTGSAIVVVGRDGYTVTGLCKFNCENSIC